MPLQTAPIAAVRGIAQVASTKMASANQCSAHQRHVQDRILVTGHWNVDASAGWYGTSKYNNRDTQDTQNICHYHSSHKVCHDLYHPLNDLRHTLTTTRRQPVASRLLSLSAAHMQALEHSLHPVPRTTVWSSCRQVMMKRELEQGLSG